MSELVTNEMNRRPQYVKPFVKRNKNDANDAEAICIAGSRREMRFISPKSLEQQDIQSIHRIRERLIGNRMVWLIK